MAVVLESLPAFLLLATLVGLLFWPVLMRLGRGRIKVRRRAFMYALAVPFLLALVFLVAGAFLEYHDEPSFCANCHSMDPFYDTFETPANNSMMSVHSEEGAGCTACHVGPGYAGQVGSFLTVPGEVAGELARDYGKGDFERELPSRNCLKCHDGVVAVRPGEVKTVANTSFDPHEDVGDGGGGEGGEGDGGGGEDACVECHTSHYGGIGLTTRTCPLCHGTLYTDFGSDLGKHADRVDGRCFSCHDRPHPDNATVPYDGTTALTTEEFCSDCHLSEYDAYTASANPASIGLYGTCAECHPDHGQGSRPHPSAGQGIHCSACHIAQDQAGRFHNRTQVSYAGVRTSIANGLCRPCHPEEAAGLVASEDHSGTRCASCHSEHLELLVTFSDCSLPDCHEGKIPVKHRADSDCTRSTCHGTDWYHAGGGD
jgi:nitrate/TMAO reductase-like tetraheme cytochrome c subunit